MARFYTARFLLVLVLTGIISLWSSPVLAESEIDTITKEWQIIILDSPIKAPDFSLPSTEGETKTLEDFQGQLVFLNFWTTW